MQLLGSGPKLIEKLKAKLKEKMGKAVANEQKDGKRLRSRVTELTERQNILIKKNLDGFISDIVLKQQLDLIEKELTDTQTSIASIQEIKIDFDDVMKYVQDYLKNPSSVWRKASLDKKLKLQWFQFPQGVVFDKEIYQTAQIASVFKTKDAFEASLSTGVDPRRFELLTFRLQSDCSTN